MEFIDHIPNLAMTGMISSLLSSPKFYMIYAAVIGMTFFLDLAIDRYEGFFL